MYWDGLAYARASSVATNCYNYIYTEDTIDIRHPRRHNTVINTIYKHHPVIGVYKIKITTLCLAVCTIMQHIPQCDLKLQLFNFDTVQPK